MLCPLDMYLRMFVVDCASRFQYKKGIHTFLLFLLFFSALQKQVEEGEAKLLESQRLEREKSDTYAAAKEKVDQLTTEREKSQSEVSEAESRLLEVQLAIQAKKQELAKTEAELANLTKRAADAALALNDKYGVIHAQVNSCSILVIKENRNKKKIFFFFCLRRRKTYDVFFLFRFLSS